MSAVVWHMAMSLDGFIAGPDHAMEWGFEAFADSGPNPLGEEVMASTGAILAGRNWYDVATERYDGRAGIYGGRWSGPVFVLTHHPPEQPGDPGITFLSGGLQDAVVTARAAAGERNLEIFGANVAQQCLAAGLLDEIAVHIAPVLLGDGVRMYGDGLRRVDLEPVSVAASGRVVDARYRVL